MGPFDVSLMVMATHIAGKAIISSANIASIRSKNRFTDLPHGRRG
jgi:hypothetical protein